MKRYKLIFKGRVQGVGFRYTSKTIADKLDLTGTVENLNNGNVECCIQGSDENIRQFLEKLQSQSYIKIESIEKSETEVKEEESSYKIIG